MAMVRAISRARIQRTIKPGPTRVALACDIIDTFTVVVASVGAHTGRAVLTIKPRIAMANTLIAKPRI